MTRARLSPLRSALTPLAGAALGVLAGCSDSGAGASAVQHRQAVPVRVATAVEKDVPVRLRAIGTVEAYANLSVKSRVEGHVAEVHFREGQEVQAGAMLFSIDAREFEAALRQAEANLARNRAEAENARVEAHRLTQLLKQQIVSQDEYDQAQTHAAAMRATVNADEAAVEVAKLQILYCRITSPIEGRIGAILVHVGNVVKPDESVLALVNQVRPVYVAFSVPQQNLSEIRRRAQAAPLRVDAYTDSSYEHTVKGELSFIDNQVSTETGTVMLKALFPNDHEELWPGQFVDIMLTLTTLPEAVVVPSAAVQTGQQGQYLYVVHPDNTVELRMVRTGADVGPEVVIEENLRPGERVVTDGQFLLAPGVTVEVKQNGTEQPGATPPAPAA
jgi:multidrug efflux system membrane fusion protein